jgi:hypothetical protein
VITGYDGALSHTVGGLVAATETAWTVAQDPDQSFDETDPEGTFAFDVEVPAGETFRAGIYEDAITPTDTDLDMFVFTGEDFVAQSADGDSNEEVTTRNTSDDPVTYTVYVHGWSTGSQPSASGTLFTWVVGAADAGNVTVTGIEPAVTGESQEHTATFTGLAAGTRYLGEVRYSDGTNVVGRTLLDVQTP